MRALMKYFLFLFLFPLLSLLAFSQFIYYPYYGKNKVLYSKFNWQHYSTDHFNIYYYTHNTQDLKNIAELSESAYQRISNKLKYQLPKKIPIIYYITHTDFEQTNIYPGPVPEGALAFAESVLYRIVLNGDLPLDKLQDLVEHELTHIFEYFILYGTQAGPIYDVRQPPLWVMEGFAEYNTESWAPISLMILRDAVFNDRMPQLTSSGNLVTQYPSLRDPGYDFGHAIYEFIEHKHGETGIRQLWMSLKHTPLMGKKDPINRTFSYKPKEFNYEFKKYLRQRFKDFLTRENPENYSFPLGPEFPANPYFFVFSHALSPSGDIVAVLTYNARDYDIDLLLISTKDGSVINNLTKGYTLKYEQIKFEIDPSAGREIAWSSDGDRIAFFARQGRKHPLFIINALNGKIIKKIKIPIDQPSGPWFFPNKNELVFAGFQGGVRDIFSINLETEKITNLTQDDLYEKAPCVSPDGKMVAYTIRIDTYDKLFLSPAHNLKQKTQLTFGRGNTIAPQFSPDSKLLYFSGDMRGAFNLYSLHLESGKLVRYTDVRTGNFFPSPLPHDSKTIIFSSFNKGAFQLFKARFEGEEEKSVHFEEKSDDETYKKFEPIVTLDINEEKISPYKGLSELYITSRPPVDAIVSTDGSIYGGSALSFSDLMGDHTFYFMAYQVRSFRSYYLAYINQRRRFQYMVNAYQYTLFYYPQYAYWDPSLYSYLSYRDAIATRKISGINLSTYYPLSKYVRFQAGLFFQRYEEEFLDPFVRQSTHMPGRSYNMLWNGNWLVSSFSIVGETTRFKLYGPASGNTFNITFFQSIPLAASFFRNTNFQLDLRQYFYLGSDIILAFRFEGFASMGKNPYIFYWGGNNQVRSTYYLNIIGNMGWFGNIELRVPLVNSASTIIGNIGPVRGVFFFDITQSKLKGYPAGFPFWDEQLNKIVWADAIGSYGYGFEFFFLGIPIHLDFTRMLEFVEITRFLEAKSIGKFQLKFWVGYDF
ncbi:MAG: hypothetical protein ACE5LC_03450 [Candidatus Aminicenantales bacterium]